jgi:TM2 domain-containing membrane protein YozV
MLIENKSNFSDVVIIPLISSLIMKYIYGDWDSGYLWSISDIFYWITIIGTSYMTVISYKKLK